MAGVRVAIEGCGHGTLHAIYASTTRAAKLKGWDDVDVLIIGGDFQAVRNSYDLNCMSVPPKYREIGDFHEYYSGARKAPYLTLFVGGNHEASNHLWELYYGGWVAPNIYYMGAANVVRVGPLRIAGLSGIWKGYNYNKAHHERIPYSPDDIKSAYHVREWDVRKLLQIRTQVDVGLSHDWPRGVEWLGDYKTLFRKKDQFEGDAREGRLGSSAAKYTMDRLRPPYWFSAHLHIKYDAVVDYKSSAAKAADVPVDLTETAVAPAKNEDEIDLDMDDVGEAPLTTNAQSAPEADTNPNEVSAELIAQLPAAFARSLPNEETFPFPADITNTETKFLALDKCLGHREFLQLIEVEPTEKQKSARSPTFEYDKEWLAITRVFANELPGADPCQNLAEDKGESYYRPLIQKEEQWVQENIVDKGLMQIPVDFAITAPIYDAAVGLHPKNQPVVYKNQHTQTFCDLLRIPNTFQPTAEELATWASATDFEPPFAPQDNRGGFRGGGRARGGGRGRSRGGFRGGRRGGRW